MHCRRDRNPVVTHSEISHCRIWVITEEHNASESSPHHPSDQTLFCMCEKFRRRARSGRTPDKPKQRPIGWDAMPWIVVGPSAGTTSLRPLCNAREGVLGGARIARIERMWSARGQGASWADIAYAARFTDQAHMVNDFTEIVGVPPAQLEDRRRERCAISFGSPLAPASSGWGQTI
jgi:AraC-like DNA-binding protein